LPPDGRTQFEEDVIELKNRNTYLEDATHNLLDGIQINCEAEMTAVGIQSVSNEIALCDSVAQLSSVLQRNSCALTAAQKETMGSLLDDESSIAKTSVKIAGEQIGSLISRSGRIPDELKQAFVPRCTQAVRDVHDVLLNIRSTPENSVQLSDMKARRDDLVDDVNELNSKVENMAILLSNNQSPAVKKRLPGTIAAMKSVHNPEEKLQLLLDLTDGADLSASEKKQIGELIEEAVMLNNEAS